MKERWEVRYTRAGHGEIRHARTNSLDASQQATLLRGYGSTADVRVVKVTTHVVRRTWTRNGWRLRVEFRRDDFPGWTWREYSGPGGCEAASARGVRFGTLEIAVEVAEEWADEQKRGPR